MLCALLAVPFAIPLAAQPSTADKPADKPAAKPDAAPKPAPEEKSSVTRHTLTLDGKTLPYTATAGTLLLKDDDGTVKAVGLLHRLHPGRREGPGHPPRHLQLQRRPGRGLALGAHGRLRAPERVARDRRGDDRLPAAGPAGGQRELDPRRHRPRVHRSGEHRLQPRRPRGRTRSSSTACSKDIESVAEFIRLWVTRNQRWASPKFVAGESYGTTRAAGLAFYLADRYGMALNGVVLDLLRPQLAGPGLPPRQRHAPASSTCRPTPPRPGTTRSCRRSSRATCSRPWRRWRPSPSTSTRRPCSRATACPTPGARRSRPRWPATPASPRTYVERSNLCVQIDRFTKELLRDQGKTVGRLDTRFTGSDLDAAGEVYRVRPGERRPRRPLRGGDQRLHPARPQVRERPRLRAADRQGLALGLGRSRTST